MIMKKILIAVLSISLLFGASYFEHNYTREECEVVYKNDATLEIKDKCGQVWVWQVETDKDIELYHSINVNDLVDLKMHDSFSSAYIGDDVIKKAIKK